ncbi:MAG: hypothetical protein ACRDNZ_12515, partial [Streptosporangiaceae bacterium]
MNSGVLLTVAVVGVIAVAALIALVLVLRRGTGLPAVPPPDELPDEQADLTRREAEAEIKSVKEEIRLLRTDLE